MLLSSSSSSSSIHLAFRTASVLLRNRAAMSSVRHGASSTRSIPTTTKRRTIPPITPHAHRDKHPHVPGHNKQNTLSTLSLSSSFDHLDQYYRDPEEKEETRKKSTKKKQKPSGGGGGGGGEFAHLEQYYEVDDVDELERCYQRLCDLLECDDAYRLTTVHCNNYMKNISRSPRLVPKAHAVLLEMERLGEAAGRRLEHCVPDAYSYMHLIRAYARCGDEDRARRVLQRMDTVGCARGYCAEPAHDVLPRTLLYSRDTTAARSVALLDELRRPHTKDLNVVLKRLSSQSHPDRAEALLREVCERYASGAARYERCRPDLISFNTVLHALRADPERAQAVYDVWRDATGETGDVYTHSAIVRAWGGRDPARATACLDRMHDALVSGHIDPTTLEQHLYTTLIRDGWGRLHGTPGAVGALGVLETMVRLSREHDRLTRTLSPNTLVYNAALSVLADRGLYGPARELVRTMLAEPDDVTRRLLRRAGNHGNTNNQRPPRPSNQRKTVAHRTKPMSLPPPSNTQEPELRAA